ncbi:MAG: tRNA (adenosine(37)-N6)-dimethylallyltransferase MiaA [Holosporales bacterium]|jgi:tRNA dimethylallyltransferase|nr:tRNA (adenosine(37)-N6)-dimethylallyltransferase MiaA [Holosporales bacterium]
MLVIAGPTACGKSALALALAEILDGEIVNADSQQLYSDLPILSAIPSEEERQRVPHHLYGILKGDAPCSAGAWRVRAQACVEAIQRRKHSPILVGGTGLYLRAFLEGLRKVPPIPQQVRQYTRTRFAALGRERFWQELCAMDPWATHHIRATDPQRMQRAYEVFQATGRSLSSWGQDSPAPSAYVVKILPDRAPLYALCDQRFDSFLAKGALDEVRGCLQHTPPAVCDTMKTIGFQELRRVLEEGVALEEAVALVKQRTRQYAKRQVTWFRRQLSSPTLLPFLITSDTLPQVCADIVRSIGHHPSAQRLSLGADGDQAAQGLVLAVHQREGRTSAQ